VQAYNSPIGQGRVKLKYKSLVGALSVSMVLAGCATKPNEISPSYVSKLEYKDYTCDQLTQEAERVSNRASQAYGLQKKQRRHDQINATVGAVIFWPSLFFIEGDGPQAVEVARLKGQMDAIEQASILKNQKGCKIRFTNS
jgi:hypothetical protein